MENYEYALSHHGIKGQKWGVRRTPEQLGRKIERTEKKISKNEAKAAKNEKKADKRFHQKLYLNPDHRNRVAQRAFRYKRLSIHYQKKVERGKKKLEKYQSILEELKQPLPESDQVQHSDTETMMEVFNTMTEKQKEVVYILMDEIIEDDELDSEAI